MLFARDTVPFNAALFTLNCSFCLQGFKPPDFEHGQDSVGAKNDATRDGTAARPGAPVDPLPNNRLIHGLIDRFDLLVFIDSIWYISVYNRDDFTM